MKHALSFIATAVVAGCHGHDHGPGSASHGHGHGHGPDDEADHGHLHGPDATRPSLSFTHWTHASELFIELPALVVGAESPCAAHVTKLEGFAALAEGRVAVVLKGGPREERFEITRPSAPGIFRPVVTPTSAGLRQLVVEVRAGAFSADHAFGEVTVFATTTAAREALPEAPEVPGRVAFLKEQQWPMAFGTTEVASHPLRPLLRVNGAIVARPDGQLLLTAPAAGRVLAAGSGFPRLGATVAPEDVLLLLTPRLEAADLASLELAVTRADLELRYAERERQRLEALHRDGAIPERRLTDANHAVDTARAARGAADRRIDQFRRTQRTASGGEGTLELQASIGGVVTEVLVAPGAFVEAGTPLLRVTDTARPWLEARVPEADLGRLGHALGAIFRVEGLDEAFELGPDALLLRGTHIDPVSRTRPVVFAVDNTTGSFAIGACARVELVTGGARQTLAVPESALVDDGGVTVVYVQVEGESFERRVVRLGVRDRGLVEVLSGVSPGERVVSRGAWSVKLAAASGGVPAHGHAH